MSEQIISTRRDSSARPINRACIIIYAGIYALAHAAGPYTRGRMRSLGYISSGAVPSLRRVKPLVEQMRTSPFRLAFVNAHGRWYANYFSKILDLIIYRSIMLSISIAITYATLINMWRVVSGNSEV